MALYIAEKPSLAEGIVNFLKKEKGLSFSKKSHYYLDSTNQIKITWLYGHMLYLVDPEKYNDDWKSWNKELLPIFPAKFKKLPYKEKKIHYSAVCELIKETDLIYHVGDPDREGQVLVDDLIKNKTNVKRLLPNALDMDSLRKAFSNVQDNVKFKGLYNAGLARSYIDWLVGMNLTRLYTALGREAGYNNVFNVGRVKTPVLYLIVQREKEITTFKPQDIFSLFAHISNNSQELKLIYQKDEDEVLTKEKSEQLQSDLKNKNIIIAEINEEEINEFAPPNFSLDTLQIEANKLFGFSSKQTLDIAQILYDTKDKEFISYPRSDCEYLPESQFEDSQKILDNALALDIISNKILATEMPKSFDDKKTATHHAVIPTKKIPNLADLSNEAKNLYLLIIKRYIAQFYPPFQALKTTILFKVEQSTTFFTYSFQKINNLGFKAFLDNSTDSTTQKSNENSNIFPFEKGHSFAINKVAVIKSQTKKPTRYTEGTLISAMKNIQRYAENKENKQKLTEIKGIGTPATRATIIDELKKSGHITMDKNHLIPTTEGKILIDFVPKSICMPDKTAEIELLLNQIENGSLTIEDVLKNIQEYIEEIINQSKKINIEDFKNKEHNCPCCEDGYLQHKKSKNGTFFFGCSNYPNCKALFSSQKGLPQVFNCPSCKEGFLMPKITAEKKVFWGCNRFPDCKTTFPDLKGAPDTKPKEIVSCPVCKEGELRKRKSSAEKNDFWGCSRYPDCKTTFPDLKGKPDTKPKEKISCPSCKEGELRKIKGVAGKSDFWSCNRYPNCKTTFSDLKGKPKI